VGTRDPVKQFHACAHRLSERPSDLPTATSPKYASLPARQNRTGAELIKACNRPGERASYGSCIKQSGHAAVRPGSAEPGRTGAPQGGCQTWRVHFLPTTASVGLYLTCGRVLKLKVGWN